METGKDDHTDDRVMTDCHEITEAEIDKTLDESFPASDPPSWTLGVVPCTDSPEEKDAELAGRLTKGAGN